MGKIELPKFRSEIAHAYYVLDPTRITAHVEGREYAGRADKPINRASLRLYYDVFGKQIEGMSHYYCISFWSRCNGVEITKGIGKSICYYGFKIGETRSITKDYRNIGFPYEKAINYGTGREFTGNGFENENVWFWAGNAMWEDLQFEEILKNLVLKSWDVYTPNVSDELKISEKAKKCRIEHQNVINRAYKRRFIKTLEYHGLITPGLVSIPPIDFTKYDEMYAEMLRYRREYIEMRENGTLPDDFEFSHTYPYY